MVALAPVILLFVCTVSQGPAPLGYCTAYTVCVVEGAEDSPPNTPPASATTAAAAATKRHRLRRRLAAARSSTVPSNSPGGRSSATVRTASSAQIQIGRASCRERV